MPRTQPSLFGRLSMLSPRGPLRGPRSVLSVSSRGTSFDRLRSSSLSPGPRCTRGWARNAGGLDGGRLNSSSYCASTVRSSRNPPLSSDNPLSVLSDNQLWNIQLLNALQCGRSKSPLRAKRRAELCSFGLVLQQEATNRGKASPTPPYHPGDLR